MKYTKLTSVNVSKKNSLFKDKLVICIQFGPKLQHLIPHDLQYAKDSFWDFVA